MICQEYILAGLTAKQGMPAATQPHLHVQDITIICYRCCATGKTDVASHHAQLSSYMHTPVGAGCILCRTGTATIHAFAAVRAALPTLRSLVLE